jgi:hypothetical protein
VLDAPFVRPEIPAYVSPASGKVISSRHQRKEDLARTGHMEWEPGMRPHIEKNRQAAIQKDVDKVCAGVDTLVRDLHTSGRL